MTVEKFEWDEDGEFRWAMPMQEDLRANLDAPVSSLTPHAYKS